MKITSFTGINNVAPEESLLADKYGACALREATNVDIDLEGEVRRRCGYTVSLAGDYGDIHEGDGFLLAVSGGNLVRIVSGTPDVIASVGTDRMWYVDFPDGRIAWSNGTSTGIVGLATSTGWGVPTPDISGVAAQGTDQGQLYAGKYLWAITYVRSDGVESAPAYAAAITLTNEQNLQLTSLPLLFGHTIRIYLAHHNGSVLRLAGETPDDSTANFTYYGRVEQLIRECKTEQQDVAPAGRCLALWRGHALVADENVLWASRHLDLEHFDLDRDFKQFSAPITMVMPVQDGVFIGTEAQLVFLRGTKFSELAFERPVKAPVVLGSGATVTGQWLQRGDSNAGQGECCVFIAGGHLWAGYQDGGSAAMTERSYSTDATEVCAAFRVIDGIPQYLALQV